MTNTGGFWRSAFASLLSLGSICAQTVTDSQPSPPTITAPLPSAKPGHPATAPIGASPLITHWKQFEKVRQPDGLFAWTTDKDHEDAGIETAGSGPYLGVSALHIVYAPGNLVLKVPAGATQDQTLYSPTTRPPNGSCLEMGTNYTTQVGAATTSASVYVFDFCRSPMNFVVTIPVDSNFMAKYTKTYADAPINGQSAYSISIFTPDTTVSNQMRWYAEIWNNQLNDWEVLYTTQGIYSGDIRGWSIFETWYRAGQCSPSLPLMTAVQLRYYNASTVNWEPVADNMQGLQNSIHAGGNCFSFNVTPASYKVSEIPTLSAWQVTSTGN
jgi:hypothetical protein